MRAPKLTSIGEGGIQLLMRSPVRAPEEEAVFQTEARYENIHARRLKNKFIRFRGCKVKPDIGRSAKLGTHSRQMTAQRKRELHSGVS